jgi:hypothetical protein
MRQNQGRRTAMIRQSLRLTFLVGLVISVVTAPGAVTPPVGTVFDHHQPAPCEPDCLKMEIG